MPHQNSLLPMPLTARGVRSYINFDGGAEVDLAGSDQAQLQSKGVAALWHLLQQKSHAYLADEVGMGKTRQAFAVITTQFLQRTDTQVVIFCPGEPLQDQWLNEWNTFMLQCYKARDDRVVSKLTGQPLLRLQKYNKLSEFARALILGDTHIHLLRYSSMSRPLHFPAFQTKTSRLRNEIGTYYLDNLRAIGIDGPTDEEQGLLRQDGSSHAWYEELTADLNKCYAGHVATLVSQSAIDLIVADEAQYLRHVGNQRNEAIAQIFRARHAKWLLLSATPLHSGKKDIYSLDNYLCRLPKGHEEGAQCGTCAQATHCTRAAYLMSPKGGGLDVMELLGAFMVRRPRRFKDGATPQNVHGKIAYRHYRRTPSAAGADPFLALTMALVQKKLVSALQGSGNRLQQGECSSFESLSASVARQHERRELEKGGRQRAKDQPETPDRQLIDQLNQRFRHAMGIKGADRAGSDPKFNLPHAKLSQVCDALAEASLRDGTGHKTLVFTRRLDTVDEMVLLLRSKFQEHLDERLEAWRGYLAHTKYADTQTWPTPGKRFWDLGNNKQRQPAETATAPPAPPGDIGTQELDRRSNALPYFRAIRDASDQQKTSRGMLVTFREQLLSTPQRNPLTRFLQPLPGAPAPDVTEQQTAHRQWQQLLALLLGDEAQHRRLPQEWMWAAQPQGDDAWKQDTLKRCILQSLRHGEFLADLYVLHHFIDDIHGVRQVPLPDKLLWLLGTAETDELPALRAYLCNLKACLLQWITHFDLIVNKCLRRDNADKWPLIYANVDPSFVRMAPVMGRSGRLQHRHAVTQFNFPTHPNILVCTDVLKEGVDMHLFCDHVVHYGVAWTSGDLEQRIGRIDRLGSLVGRRIAAHTAQDGNALPRLSVDFPYLEGTLDQYQVERVMREKIKSDRRMDLGRHEEDIGQISLDEFDQQERSLPEHDGSEQAKQYPDTTLHLLDGDDDAVLASCRTTTVPTDVTTEGCAAHVPALGILAWRVDAGTERLMRQITRDKGMVWQQEYLVAVDGANVKPGPALSNGRLQALSMLPLRHSFHFDTASGTLLRLVPTPNPYGHFSDSTQPVWLERLQDFLLLRTPVADVSATLQTARNDWDGVIPEYNGRRQWGYLTIDDGMVWLVCLLLDIPDSHAGTVLDPLSSQLALAAARLRHLRGPGSTGTPGTYRAVTRLEDLHIAHAAHFNHQPDIFMSANSDHLQAHGRLLAGTQQWLSSVFKLVFDSLDNGTSTVPLSIALLPNGVLHVRATGVATVPDMGNGQFQLEAYLQLAPDDGATTSFGAPRMIWQITANKHTGVRGRALQLSSWNELPHLLPSKWSGISDKNGAVYHSRTDQCRSLVLYHAPDRWDGARRDMLEPWGLLMRWLMAGKFQATYASRAFFKAFDGV